MDDVMSPTLLVLVVGLSPSLVMILLLNYATWVKVRPAAGAAVWRELEIG